MLPASAWRGLRVARVDDRLEEQIEDAEAPFWAHVRDALAERDP
jgi:hypothetical protein